MQELRWYDRTETFTRPGLAFTVVVLRDSTPPSEVPEEFYQARKKLGDEANSLPRGVFGPIVNDEYADVTFALYALKANGEPLRRLVRDAETLRQRLLHVQGVKKVNIIGEQAERIFVEFSYDRLATLGVTPQDIFAALNSRNVMTPAGSIESKGPQVFVRLDGAIDDLQDIRDTPVAARGRTLKLSDIAEVKRGYEDPARHDSVQGHRSIRQYPGLRRRIHGQVLRCLGRRDARVLSRHGLARWHRRRGGGAADARRGIRRDGG